MDQSFEELLEYLKVTRGFDVTSYKRTSLTRRVRHRMQAVGIESFKDYQDYLEVHPDEFSPLFNTILINVTGFFRDDQSWEFMAAEVVPRILAGKATGVPIRVWTAGCASGEEAYTAVMVFAEALGAAEARARVKVYATDLNEGDLSTGRQASYTAKHIEAVPPHLRDRYFRQVGQYSVFDSDLRRLVVFGRHDLLQDSPISHIDLLICRNTLMYFNAEAQARVLHRFHFALNDSGFLFLGKAEMLLANTDLFTPLDIKRRIFVKNPGHPEYALSALEVAARANPGVRRFGVDSALPAAALQSAPVAQLVIDTEGRLATANESARRLFALTGVELGRPIGDLPLSHRPIDLAAYVQQVGDTGRPVILREVGWPGNGDGADIRAFDVQIVPLFDTGNQSLGVSASYSEVTQFKRLREDLQQVTEERETTHEELQTTNEELQSTVEELETTNEELQSTNEELETMNEELQSTNEELRSSNEALRQQGETLDEVNGFWESVMASLHHAMVIVDREFKVLVWNRKATDLWGLRSEEVRGRNFLSLDIGLPVDRLKAPIRSCFQGEPSDPAVVPATNRRGKPVYCQVSCSPLNKDPKKPAGVILLMEEVAVGGAS